VSHIEFYVILPNTFHFCLRRIARFRLNCIFWFLVFARDVVTVLEPDVSWGSRVSICGVRMNNDRRTLLMSLLKEKPLES
jgi:hypothetical protein